MAISFKSLSYVYNPDMPFKHIALDNIDLDIKEGVITALIGETGSGKSTLIEHLNALLLPTSGSLEILDFEISADKKNKGLKKLRKDVGLVFQFSEYQLFEETILRDVAFGPKNFGISEEESFQRAKDALKLVGMGEEYYNINPLELSGGQKRRVAIAGILAIDPKVIVLDEPTAGLDPKGSKDIIELFVELNKKAGKTIIIVSHDNEMVYNYAEEVVVLSHGKIRYHGDVVDLFNDVDKIKEFDLLAPQIVQFKNELREIGFKINERARNLEDVVKSIKDEVRR